MKPNGRKRASFCLENVQAKLERITPIPVLLIKAISKQKDVRGVRSALAPRDITVKEERQKTNSQSTGTACFTLLLSFVYRQAKLLPTHPFRRGEHTTFRLEIINIARQKHKGAGGSVAAVFLTNQRAAILQCPFANVFHEN